MVPRTEAPIQVSQEIDAGDSGRTLVARGAAVLAIAALAPAFFLIEPISRWDQPVLLLAVVAIALLSLWGMVAIKPAVFLNAEFVAVLLALALLGALPAACVWLSAEAVYFVIKRRPVEAHVSNLASFGWAVLAGAFVLKAFGADPITSHSGVGDYAALAGAVVAMLCVNFAIARTIVGVILQREGIGAMLREELIRPAPATLLMAAAGIAMVLLYTRVGILALAIFGVVVVIPQNLLPVLLRPRRVSEVPFCDAVALYASAIARRLGLDRKARLVLSDASTFLDPSVYGPVQGKLSSDDVDHCIAVQETLVFYREHWSAPGGTPGALEGALIPLTSRILSVADIWARLTAAGSQELSHTRAVGVLESRAGYHFDPAVVNAVAQVVAAEHLGEFTTAYEPRLQSMRLPALLARLGTPAAEPA